MRISKSNISSMKLTDWSSKRLISLDSRMIFLISRLEPIQKMKAKLHMYHHCWIMSVSPVHTIDFVLHWNHSLKFTRIHMVSSQYTFPVIWKWFISGGTFDFQALAKRLWGDLYYDPKTWVHGWIYISLSSDFLLDVHLERRVLVQIPVAHLFNLSSNHSIKSSLM